MSKLTIVFGALLVALGLLGFGLTGWQHPTALIPAGAGIIFAVLGVAGLLFPGSRKHVMHAASALALLGFLATVTGLIELIRWTGGTVPQRPPAAISKAIMSGLCLLFVALCVRSFINARRNRELQGPPPDQSSSTRA